MGFTVIIMLPDDYLLSLQLFYFQDNNYDILLIRVCTKTDFAIINICKNILIFYHDIIT